MFGNNTVQSSWANPQQNQQQQQPQQGASAFGQPNTFGSGGAFGSTGAFGQPQQQPQANPMFGNLGTPSTNTNTGSGFGTFGSNPAQTGTTNSIFGAPKPATGFGAFGGAPSTFGGGGGGGTFGSTANSAAGPSGTTSSIFGSSTNTANTASPFGGGGSLFSQNKPAAGFGTTPTTSQQGAFEGVAPVTTGSANPPFSVFNEKDQANQNVQYQSMTAMPHYRGSSFEELRVQDYQQGRKTAGAFGQTSFGSTATTQPSAGAFSAPAQTGNSMFGNANNAFGNTNPAQPSTTTGGAFGSFGQTTNAPNTAGTGSSLFGGGAFGQTQQQPQQQQQQQQQQQPTAGFGTFGQTQQPATGTGAFGSGFGQQNKPATGFGTFGTNNNALGGTNTFSQPANQQQTNTTGTGLFGQSQQSQPAGGFGSFGTNNANNAAKPSIFGAPSQPAAPTTGFSGFNQTQPQGQQTQPTGNLFGNTGGSIFAQPQQNQVNQQQPNQTQPTSLFNPSSTQPNTGLFGNTGNLFGNNQQTQQQPAQNTGLFAPKPATSTPGSGGLFSGGFGQTNTTAAGTGQQTSIFGQPLGQSTAQQPAAGTNTFGSSLFNAPKPNAPTLGMSTSTGQTGGSTLFGNTFGQSGMLNASASAPGAQGTLTASINQPIGSNLPIFSMLPPGPRAVTLEQQPKKKPGFFVDVPTRSVVPRLQLGYTPANSKLRGFASSTSMSSMGGQSINGFPGGLSLTSGKPNALSLSRMDGRASVGPDAFLNRSSSPSLGGGGRQSVKKLILDKKVEPSDLFSKSGGSPGMRSSPGKVTFSPALSQAAREKEVMREKELASSTTISPATNRIAESPTPAARNMPNRFTAQSSSSLINDSRTKSPAKGDKESAPLQHGDYWVKPDLQTLIHAGYEELVAFEKLVVGRVGYGEIQFLEPVDLTGLPKLGALLGELVRFDDKECSVYPDSDDADKPPPGTGLNVRARIALLRCWAVDKATREPIKDEKQPNAVKHLKRLKAMKDTHFESFDITEGKWTFTVEHF